jgi:hypothetical protein
MTIHWKALEEHFLIVRHVLFLACLGEMLHILIFSQKNLSFYNFAIKTRIPEFKGCHAQHHHSLLGVCHARAGHENARKTATQVAMFSPSNTAGSPPDNARVVLL